MLSTSQDSSDDYTRKVAYKKMHFRYDLQTMCMCMPYNNNVEVKHPGNET